MDRLEGHQGNLGLDGKYCGHGGKLGIHGPCGMGHAGGKEALMSHPSVAPVLFDLQLQYRVPMA